MDNAPVDMNNLKKIDKTEEKMTEAEQEEAYFELCQIIAFAQNTGDYDRFLSDLREWKKRYDIELFDEEFKAKIKYMLSEEFLDKVLKDFTAFSKLAEKNPEQELKRLKKVFKDVRQEKDRNKAEKFLDKNLEILEKEHVIEFLKKKYPHITKHLLSTSYRQEILEQFEPFDQPLAIDTLKNIVENPQDYESSNQFKSEIEEWQKLYPIKEFADEYKPQVEKMVNDNLNEQHLQELFPITVELDLAEEFEIPIENISIVSKDALYDFLKISDKNIDDIDSLFDWTCKYTRYINSFDSSVKDEIVQKLMQRYKRELPETTHYFIPEMDNNEFLSLSDYKSITDTKKMAILQLLGILSSGQQLTHNDIYNLNVIKNHSDKVIEIQEANIDEQVNDFMSIVPENELTPLTITSNEDLTAEIKAEDTTVELKNNGLEADTITIEENPNMDNTHEINKIDGTPKIDDNIDTSKNEIEENLNTDNNSDVNNNEIEKTSFKEAIKVDTIEGIELERVENDNKKASTNNSTGTTTSGGGVSISRSPSDESDEESEKDDSDDLSQDEIEEPIKDKASLISNLLNRIFGGKKQQSDDIGDVEVGDIEMDEPNIESENSFEEKSINEKLSDESDEQERY